jgi:hypothetical protein
MLSSLDELGRTGFTAIADSAADAQDRYERVESTLIGRARGVASRGIKSSSRSGRRAVSSI